MKGSIKVKGGLGKPLINVINTLDRIDRSRSGDIKKSREKDQGDRGEAESKEASCLPFVIDCLLSSGRGGDGRRKEKEIPRRASFPLALPET